MPRPMAALEISHETPNGTVAYAASLFYDDGEYPNAGEEHHGYHATESEAWAAVRAALATKPTPPADGGWTGCPEKGTFVRDDDDEWFVPPTFTPDPDYYAVPEWAS